MDVATRSVESVPAAVDPYQPAGDAPRERPPVELLPWLPCMLTLEVPVINFTVGTLLRMSSGTLVESAWHQSTDIPLRVNGLLMAWTEFEVVGERLAARITDLI